MESQIPLLSSTSLLSVLLPYYSSTHHCFLLLSVLSRSSRSNLISFYAEFRRFMLPYCSLILINSNWLSTFPPWDLFKLDFTPPTLVEDRKTASLFSNIIRKFIRDITQRRGWYFEHHYMHEQICTMDIQYFILSAN